MALLFVDILCVIPVLPFLETSISCLLAIRSSQNYIHNRLLKAGFGRWVVYCDSFVAQHTEPLKPQHRANDSANRFNMGL